MSGADPGSAAQWVEARRWFAKAIEDLQMADLTMGSDPPLTEPAAYDCQQAAEKLFKGLLVGAAVTVPRTHDLEQLAVLLDGLHPAFDGDIQNLAVLSPWAVETRYPQLDTDAGVTEQDVRQAISDLSMLRDKVLKLASHISP